MNDLLQNGLPAKGTDAGKVYQRPVIQGFSNSHLVVGIYNRDQHLVFTTGQLKSRFTRLDEQIKLVAGRHHKVLVGRIPVYNHQTQRLTGYLQIENNLNNYYQRYQRLLLISGLALTLVVIASGLLGYGLSYLILRPLDDIQTTIWLYGMTRLKTNGSPS